MSLASALASIQPRRILVVGDLILDRYTRGKMARISPEAPVPVLTPIQQDSRPGGAGNVALNLRALGQEVLLIGRIGDDRAGVELRSLLNAEGIDLDGILVDPSIPTTLKTRLIAIGQQILRIDQEERLPLEARFEAELIARLPMLADGVDAIAISDYSKGMLTPALIGALIDLGLPVIVDPKGLDYRRYRGATLIKPNLKEAREAARLGEEALLEEIALFLLAETEAQHLVVTRSEAGISLFDSKARRKDFPVQVREVRDVTGAGDTVLALFAASLANGLPVEEGVKLANLAAGLAVERFGCARITLNDLAQRLLPSEKIFDESYLMALRQALGQRPYTLLQWGGGEGLTASLLAQLEEFDRPLVLYLDPADRAIAPTLSALPSVDFVVVCPATLEALVEEKAPESTFCLDAGNLIQVPKAQSILAALSR